ncbi:MAG TPA: methyltransferase domain-containing protein [Sphingomicrobium sp.]
MPELFDMSARALRRDRAALQGPELFLHERAFEDCLERIALMQRPFERALLIGCPDPRWPERLEAFARQVDVREPGVLFALAAKGETLVEDAWLPPEATYDLVVALGTLDTVNELPLAIRLIGHSLKAGGLLIGAVSGGDTLLQLRNAMRAADAAQGAAAPHVHPRIEASALAPLLADAGFVNPVVDIDRVPVSYRSFERLILDLRAMAATNVLAARPRFMSRAARAAAAEAFAAAGDGSRTVETFEILHFAAWTQQR